MNWKSVWATAARSARIVDLPADPQATLRAVLAQVLDREPSVLGEGAATGLSVVASTVS